VRGWHIPQVFLRVLPSTPSYSVLQTVSNTTIL
jgi:hypothetical protein